MRSSAGRRGAINAAAIARNAAWSTVSSALARVPNSRAAPEIAALAREMAGNLIVLKVNTEEHQDLAARYRVQSIPNFVLFRHGAVAAQQAGLMPRAQMRLWIEQH